MRGRGARLHNSAQTIKLVHDNCAGVPVASKLGLQHAKVAMDCLQPYHGYEGRPGYQWRSAMR